MQRHHLYALAAFTIPLLFYVCSLDGDVGFWDTAELNTVPYMLGLAHPGGFPAEVLLGWVFSHAMPVGEISYRLALLNAIEMAGSALIAYLFVTNEGANPLAGVLAALGFALSPTVWRHATHTDEMAPAVFLTCATFALVRRFWRCGRGRFLFAAAVVGGLDVGTHGAAVLYLLVPGTVAIAAFRPASLKRFALAAALFVTIACAVYAYLPLRSSFVVAHRLDPTLALGLPAGRPFWDWGDPRTAQGFVEVVTGKRFAAPAAMAAYGDARRVARSVGYGLGGLRNAMGLPALVLTLALCIALAVDDPALVLYLLAPALLVSPFVASFSAEPDPVRYYLFPAWALWSGAALGLCVILRRVVARASAQSGVVLGMLAVVALCEIYAGRSLFVQRKDHLGFTYIDAVIARTTDNAVIVAPWTYITPLAYAAYAQHRTKARIVVAGEADDFADRIPRWMANDPVFAISENAPTSPYFRSSYLCNFYVVPGSAHDPKLFRIFPATDRALTESFVTGRRRASLNRCR